MADLITDEFYGTDSSGSQEIMSWISWFCSIAGHEYFSEIPDDFIEDDFNLCGLSILFDQYDRALDIILDAEPDEDYVDEEQASRIEEQAERLYCLIHQRYILTRHGLHQMNMKFQHAEFGTCPRDLCFGAHTLPCGMADGLGVSTVKLYCPSCQDIYNPPSSRFNVVDGAAFGTTFPHMFMLTYPEVIYENHPQGDIQLIHEERMFGFRVSSKAMSAPKMKWLRRFIRPEDFKEGELVFAAIDQSQDQEMNMEEGEEEEEDLFQGTSGLTNNDAGQKGMLFGMDPSAMEVDSPRRSIGLANSDSTTSINPAAGESKLNGH